DPFGHALTQREQVIEEVERESAGNFLARLQRALSRRLPPPAQTLARVLGDAGTVVVRLAEHDHRSDVAELRGGDQRIRRRLVILREDDAGTEQFRLQAEGAGLLARGEASNEVRDLLVADAGIAAR